MTVPTPDVSESDMHFRNRDTKLDVLGRLPLFQGLSRADLQRIGALGDLVDVPAGKTLIRQGDLAREFFVLESGRVRVTVDGEDVATIGAGEFFGELAVIDLGHRTATVTTLEPSRVFVMSSPAFGGLVDSEPRVAARILRVVGSRLRALTEIARNGQAA